MKTFNRILALVLMVAGLSNSQFVGAAGKILEATGFQAIKTPNGGTNTNNTWDPVGTTTTYGTRTTVANGVTITGPNMCITTSTIKIKENSAMTISAASGYAIYRIVFKPKSSGGTSSWLNKSNGVWYSNDTWYSASDPYTYDNGKTSVTFTNPNANGAEFVINSINVYTYRTASNAEASLSKTSFEMAAGDAETFTTKLTTNKGTFDGANSPYQSQIETDASSSDIEMDQYLYSTYSNNSNISFDVYAYNVGVYTGHILLGSQTSADAANNYHMLSLYLDFTVTVTEDCTPTTLTFGDAGPINKSLTDAAFTNAATISPAATGQSVSYSSSNEDVAEVNSSGQVTIHGIGTTTITASTTSNSTYCGKSASYTLNVSGFSVTYHYPSCETNKPSNLTNQGGTISLPTNLSVEGYDFVGWTTNSSFADGSSEPTPCYKGSVSVTSNMNLYAVYRRLSNTFNLIPKNTTLTEGDYVLSTSYNKGDKAKIMTNTLDANKRMTVDNDSYTFVEGALTCTNDDYIWHLTPTGNSNEFTVYNAKSSKYLAANDGSTSSSDRQMRLESSVTNNYQKWNIAQSGANTVPYQVKNVGRNAIVGVSNNSTNYYVGYFNTTTTIYFFKRTAVANSYTINPNCNAAEYTVTMVQPAQAATVTASATGGTWNEPVLSGLHGGETVTISATAATGYDFSSWTVKKSDNTSVSVADASSATTTFTMPTKDVTATPNFTPKVYTITYKDKGNVAFTGTPASPTPATHTYGTPTTLPSEFTKTNYEFMGWYTDASCTDGNQKAVIGATEITDNITVYAKWMRFSSPLAACPEPRLELTGDNVFVTSTNGKSVRAVNTLTVTAINLVGGGTVRLTSTSADVYFSTDKVPNFSKGSKPLATLDIEADSGGDIDQTVYVHYKPSAAGTGAPTNVTVTATYQELTSLNVSQDVHVRNLPSQFVIATKVGSSWYALIDTMKVEQNPKGVLIDVDETNYTAKGPATLAYSLWPVKTTATAQDVYESKGEWLRFAGNADKGLWANNNTSNYTIRNYAAVSNTTADGDAYMWQVTTTPLDALAPNTKTWKYTLTTSQANNTNDLRYWLGKWGTYTSSDGTNEIYLLPLTVTTPANISVMEWGTNSIALKCAASTTLTSVYIDGTEVSPKPTLATLTGDIMRLTGIGDLWDNKMKKMVINVSEGGSPKVAILTIPFIVTDTKTAIDLRNFAEGSSQAKRNDVISSVDVVVRNGGQLNVTTAEGNATACTFKDLYIYPGGKLNVSTNNLGVQNVYLRGGFSWLDASKDYRLPQMLVAAGKTLSGVGNSGNGVYYDLMLDNAMYYMTAFPRDVAFSAITNEEGTDDWTAWIYTYSGKGRTESPKYSTTPQWTAAWNGADHVSRGIGYEIAIKPRNSRWYGILRFPLLKSAAWSDETDCKPQIVAWGMDQYNAGTLTANNVGWNLLGNPFFSALSGATENIVSDGLKPHLNNGAWDGHYDWTTETHKYYTIYNKMDYDYSDYRLSTDKIEPFYPFFIQTNVGTEASPATTKFLAASHRALKAPRRFAAMAVNKELIVDFSLTADNGKQDVAGLTINDSYSAHFDLDDKEKSIDSQNSRLKLYTVMDGYRIAFNALPEAALNEVPVGFIAAEAGEMAISLKEHSDLSYFEQIILTDNELQLEWDLLQDAYTFSTDAMPKGNDTRFTLSLKIKQQTDIGTGLPNTGAGLDRLSATGYDGMMVLHGVPENAEVYVFDMNGKLLERVTSGTDSRLQLTNLPTGVYNVRVVVGHEAQTLRTIVR